MILLQPNALLLLLLLPLVVLLHLIRSRYRRERVPSTLLWRRLPRDLQAYATWRRPLWDLLLLLQLLAVVAAAVALARPSLPANEARHLALVLDGSASMAAADVRPSRFAAAQRIARDQIGKLNPNDLVTLVLAGPRPRVLSQDRPGAPLLAALERARPTAQPADMASALALAASLAAVQPGQQAEVVAITDGAFELDATALPTPVRFLNVGGGGDNLAISEASVRRTPTESVALSVFARLTNYSSADAEGQLQVTADGLPVYQRVVRVPAAGMSEVAFPVPEGTRHLQVALATGDPQPTDDLVDLEAPASHPRRVLVVSESPELWERVLRAVPQTTVQSVAPDAYGAPPPDAVLLLDAFLPERLPANDLIVVNPPPNNSRLVSVTGELGRLRVRAFDRDDPLLRGVDLGPVVASRGQAIRLPPWASAAAETDGGPLLLHGTWEQRRVVVFAFDPHVSNLPQLAAFPVLMANTINWLTPGRTDEVRGGLQEETNILPRQHEAIPAVQEARGGPLPEREFWPLFAAVALAVMGAEWWAFTRRG